MNDTAVIDRVFKTVILVFLIFSILIQIVFSVWFYDKFKMLESRLTLYPVNKPAEVYPRETIPELAEINRKIDRLSKELSELFKAPQAFAVPQRNTEATHSSKSVRKKAKPKKSTASTQVDVVEKIGK